MKVIILGVLSGMIFAICGVGMLVHPWKFLILVLFYWGSIIYVKDEI